MTELEDVSRNRWRLFIASYLWPQRRPVEQTFCHPKLRNYLARCGWSVVEVLMAPGWPDIFLITPTGLHWSYTGQKLWPSKDPLESECNILNAKYQGDQSNTPYSSYSSTTSTTSCPATSFLCEVAYVLCEVSPGPWVSPCEGDYKCQWWSKDCRSEVIS